MKILVPSNFSKIANEALKSAVALGTNQNNVQINVVHFVEGDHDAVVKFEDQNGNGDVKISFENELIKYPGVDIQGYFILYASESQLFKSLDSLGGDLIVMGTNEVERYEDERLIGKHTKECMKNLHTPILCIRKPIENTKFQKIVFTTNFKSSQIEDINKLYPLLNYFDVEVEVLLINTPEKFITSDKAEHLFLESSKLIKYPRLKFKQYNEIGVVEGIVSYCKKQHVDLLILPTQGRKGLDRFFNGSISELVLDQIRIPAISILE